MTFKSTESWETLVIDREVSLKPSRICSSSFFFIMDPKPESGRCMEGLATVPFFSESIEAVCMDPSELRFE